MNKKKNSWKQNTILNLEDGQDDWCLWWCEENEQDGVA